METVVSLAIGNETLHVIASGDVRVILSHMDQEMGRGWVERQPGRLCFLTVHFQVKRPLPFAVAVCLYPFCLNLLMLIAFDRVTQESSGFDEHLISDLFPSHNNTVLPFPFLHPYSYCRSVF